MLELQRFGWDRPREGIYLERAFALLSRNRIVNYDDLAEGMSFDAELNAITGAVNAGTYVVRYSATDRNGTTEGSVTITATPSKLRAPGMLPAFNTYDQKFSVYPFYKRNSDMSAVSQFEWTSTVTVDGVGSRVDSCLEGPSDCRFG